MESSILNSTLHWVRRGIVCGGMPLSDPDTRIF